MSKTERQPDEISRAFGARLRDLRLAAGLSQAALGERCGYSDASVNRLEKGKQWPSSSQIIELSNALGVHWLRFFIPEKDAQDADLLARFAALEPERRAHLIGLLPPPRR